MPSDNIARAIASTANARIDDLVDPSLIEVDSDLDKTSVNPVQNKVLATKFENTEKVVNKKADKTYVDEADNALETRITTLETDKADDDKVVHKTGSEIIKGKKVLEGPLSYLIVTKDVKEGTHVDYNNSTLYDWDGITVVDDKYSAHVIYFPKVSGTFAITDDIRWEKGEGKNSIVQKESNSSAKGALAVAHGLKTHATGEGSHAEGLGSTASGEYSHVEGVGTVANNRGERAAGAGNKSNADSEMEGNGTRDSFGIGNPDDPRNHKNAYEILRDGSYFLKGVGGYDGTNPTESKTLQEVVNEGTSSTKLDIALTITGVLDEQTATLTCDKNIYADLKKAFDDKKQYPDVYAHIDALDPIKMKGRIAANMTVTRAEDDGSGFMIEGYMDDLDSNVIQLRRIQLTFTKKLAEGTLKFRNIEQGSGEAEKTFVITMEAPNNGFKKLKKLIRSKKPGTVIKFGKGVGESSGFELTITSDNFFDKFIDYRKANGRWPNNVKGMITSIEGSDKVEYSYDATTLGSINEDGQQMVALIGNMSTPSGESRVGIITIMIMMVASQQYAQAVLTVVGSGSNDYEPSHIGSIKEERYCTEEYQMQAIYGYDTRWKYIGKTSDEGHKWERIAPTEYNVYIEGKGSYYLEESKQAIKGEDYKNTIRNDAGEFPRGIRRVSQSGYELKFKYDSASGHILIAGEDIGSYGYDDIIITPMIPDEYYIDCRISGTWLETDEVAYKGVDYEGVLNVDTYSRNKPKDLIAYQGNIQLPLTYNKDYSETECSFTIDGKEIGKLNEEDIKIVEPDPEYYNVLCMIPGVVLESPVKAQEGKSYSNRLIPDGAALPDKIKVMQGSTQLETNYYSPEDGVIEILYDQIGKENENIVITAVQPEVKTPLYVEAINDSDVMLMLQESEAGGFTHKVDVEYSTDECKTWNKWAFGSENKVSLKAKERIYIRNNTNEFSMGADDNYINIYTTDLTKVGGRLDSLINNDKPSDYCFANLFVQSHVYDASELVFPDTCPFLMAGGLFHQCEYLEIGPAILPASEVGARGYAQMFFHCTKLTNMPYLPATKVGDYGYYEMFNGCSNLINVKPLAAKHVGVNSYDGMFYACTALKEGPEIFGEEFADVQSCRWMFRNCTNLQSIKIHYTGDSISRGMGTAGWVLGVSNEGTFYYNGKDETRDSSSIPEGWKVEQFK